MSTPNTDSETAVTPTPAQTPTEPADTVEAADTVEQPAEVTEAPTDVVQPAEVAEAPTDLVVEAAEAPSEQVEPAESVEPSASAEPVEVTAEPAEPVDVTDEPTEPVDATEKPTDEPTETLAVPAEAEADAATATTATGLRSRRMLVPIVLAALALGSAVAVAVLGWQAISDSRAQRAQDTALDAAKTSTTQVLSYDSKTLDADLGRARTLISGAFAAKFEELASSVIVPAVKQQNLGTKATVARSAVIDAQPDQVRALLFVNQTTTVGSDPAPHTASNQVRVTMTWTDGHWLISDLQPL